MKKFLHVTKKFLYRAIPFAVALIIFCYLPLSVNKVHAATTYNVLDYNDYVSQTSYDGVGERVICDFPSSLNYVQTSHYTMSSSSWSTLDNYNGVTNFTLEGGGSINLGDRDDTQLRFVYRPLGYSVLKLSNIPENTGFWFVGLFGVYINSSSDTRRITFRHSMQYYDENFNALSIVNLSEVNSSSVKNGNHVFNLNSEGNLLPPAGAVYAMPRIEGFFVLNNSSSPYFGQYNVSVGNAYRISLGIGSHYRYLEQQQITNDYLESMVNGTTSQNQQAGIVSGEMSSAGNDLDSLSDSLEVSRPNINTGEFSPTHFTDIVSINALSNCFQEIWKNPIALSVITLIICFVFVSFIFFGSKR